MLFRRGACRLIIVSKFSNENLSPNAPNQLPKQFAFSLNDNQLIQDIDTYLQTFPISSEENDLLQAKIQKTPASLNGYFSNITHSSHWINLLFQIGFIVRYFVRVILYVNHWISKLEFQTKNFSCMIIIFRLIRHQLERISFI